MGKGHGYEVLNKTRKKCPRCGHNTSLFIISEGLRRCSYWGCYWDSTKVILEE